MSGGGSVFNGTAIDTFPGNHPYRELTDAITAIEQWIATNATAQLAALQAPPFLQATYAPAGGTANTLYGPANGSSYTVSGHSGTWTTGANGFLVPAAGIYIVMASVKGGATAYLQSHVMVNGSAVEPAQMSYTSAANEMNTVVVVNAAANTYIGQQWQDGATETVNLYLNVVGIGIG